MINPKQIEQDINRLMNCVKIHKHSISITALKTEKLSANSTSKVELPIKVQGVALTAGKFKGQSGEEIYYPPHVIKNSATLLSGCQIRRNHNETDPHEVIGYVTKSWHDVVDGVDAIRYEGNLFDFQAAEDVQNQKIKNASVSPICAEIKGADGTVCTNIADFAELSILTPDRKAACEAATVEAS